MAFTFKFGRKKKPSPTDPTTDLLAGTSVTDPVVTPPVQVPPVTVPSVRAPRIPGTAVEDLLQPPQVTPPAPAAAPPVVTEPTPDVVTPPPVEPLVTETVTDTTDVTGMAAGAMAASAAGRGVEPPEEEPPIEFPEWAPETPVDFTTLAEPLQGIMTNIWQNAQERAPMDTSWWWRNSTPPGRQVTGWNGIRLPLRDVSWQALLNSPGVTFTTEYHPDMAGNLIPLVRVRGTAPVTELGSTHDVAINTLLPPPWLPPEILAGWPLAWWPADQQTEEPANASAIVKETLLSVDLSDQMSGSYFEFPPVDLKTRGSLGMAFDAAVEANPALESQRALFDKLVEEIFDDVAHGRVPSAAQLTQLSGLLGGVAEEPVEEPVILTPTIPAEDPDDTRGTQPGDGDVDEFDIDAFIASFTESLSGIGITEEEVASITQIGHRAIRQKLSGRSFAGMGRSSAALQDIAEGQADILDRLAGAEAQANIMGTQIALRAADLLLGQVGFDEEVRLAQIEMANEVFLRYEEMRITEVLGLTEQQMRAAFYQGQLEVEEAAIMLEHWAKMTGLQYDRERIQVGLEAIKAQSGFDWTTFVMGMAGTAIQTYALTQMGKSED